MQPLLSCSSTSNETRRATLTKHVGSFLHDLLLKPILPVIPRCRVQLVFDQAPSRTTVCAKLACRCLLRLFLGGEAKLSAAYLTSKGTDQGNLFPSSAVSYQGVPSSLCIPPYGACAAASLHLLAQTNQFSFTRRSQNAPQPWLINTSTALTTPRPYRATRPEAPPGRPPDHPPARAVPKSPDRPRHPTPTSRAITGPSPL